MSDWLEVALVLVLLVALGIGAGIVNNLAGLTAEVDAKLTALHELLDSRLRELNNNGSIERGLEPIARLATALLDEKSEAHKCPECGALPFYETNRDTLGKESGNATLARLVLSGGLIGGSWRYTYHFENCSRREPGTAVITSPKDGEE